MEFVGFILLAFTVLIVSADARGLKQRGASVRPNDWAIFVFLLCGIALPLYIYLRLSKWLPEIERKQHRATLAKNQPIALACPCGRQLRVKSELAGRLIYCPDCKEKIVVPEPEATPATAEVKDFLKSLE